MPRSSSRREPVMPKNPPEKGCVYTRLDDFGLPVVAGPKDADRVPSTRNKVVGVCMFCFEPGLRLWISVNGRYCMYCPHCESRAFIGGNMMTEARIRAFQLAARQQRFIAPIRAVVDGYMGACTREYVKPERVNP